LQQNYEKIQAAGAELFAISSENVTTTRRTIENEGLTYPVLADSNKVAITAYNVVDPDNKHIARPASYILKKDGTVAWKSLDKIGARVPTADILAELGKF
jgi:peroxiredoxin